MPRSDLRGTGVRYAASDAASVCFEDNRASSSPRIAPRTAANRTRKDGGNRNVTVWTGIQNQSRERHSTFFQKLFQSTDCRSLPVCGAVQRQARRP